VFEVLATSGEMFLGGDDIDDAIVGMMVDAFERAHNRSPRGHAIAMERLRSAAEELKIELSENLRSSILIEDVVDGRPLEFALSEADLRWAIAPIVRRTVPVCEDALRAAGIAPHQIDEIVLVGGTTRLPMVRELVHEVFGKPPQTSINPMSVVAVGAAIQAAALLGSLVPVAGGGASTAVLLDVTPRSLGVRTLGGYVDAVIERNTPIPVEQTRLFTTTTDNQRIVRIQVCQGESEDFDSNQKLGELTLAGLRDAPRGEVTIAVTFEINADGLLEVRAVDHGTGQYQSATMRVLGGLTDEELDAVSGRLGRRDDATAHDTGAVVARPVGPRPGGAG